MTQSTGRILVIRGGAIGDFILTLPVLAALRQQFPGVHLEVLGYPHIAQLAAMGGLVHAVRPIEARPLAGFFARAGDLDEAWQAYFNSFDLIISYLYDPDAVFRTNVALCSKAQLIVGPCRPQDSDPRHATEVLLAPLERLAIFDADATPRLACCAVIGAPVSHGRWLAMHPGSGSERKNWPEPKWAELITAILEETDLHLLLVGGEVERDRLRRLAAGRDTTRIAVAQHLPLPELASWLKAAVGFVGHDSGITHLAAALGLPCLVLWGDTSERVWRPKGDRVRLLNHPDGLSALPVATVGQELAGLLRIINQP